LVGPLLFEPASPLCFISAGIKDSSRRYCCCGLMSVFDRWRLTWLRCLYWLWPTHNSINSNMEKEKNMHLNLFRLSSCFCVPWAKLQCW